MKQTDELLGKGTGEILQHRRAALALTPEIMADIMGILVPHYWDLEANGHLKTQHPIEGVML